MNFCSKIVLSFIFSLFLFSTLTSAKTHVQEFRVLIPASSIPEEISQEKSSKNIKEQDKSEKSSQKSSSSKKIDL